MAMKRGDLIREWSAEDYQKPFEIDRLMKTKGTRLKSDRKRLAPRALAKAHPRLFAIMLAMLVFSLGAYGYASLTILVPHVPAHGLLMNCPSVVPSKTSVVVNSTGFVLVTCTGSGVLRALAGTNATANYTLPSPYLDLYLYPAGQDSVITTKCTDAPAALNLQRSVVFGFEGNWSLCSDYGPVGAAGLPEFSVGWTVS